jgi:NADH-quinone oxidoreductase subunit N
LAVSHPELVVLSPLLLVALAAVADLVLISFWRSERAAAIVAFVGLLLAFAALPVAASYVPRSASSLLVVDRYALFFIGLILVAGMTTVVLSYGYLRESGSGELYVLFLLATMGAAVLAASDHFASFFLGLEILSVSLYALIGYRAPRAALGPAGIEAALKYLVLAGASAAILLFGMALVYAALGTLDFGTMAELIAGGEGARGAVWLTGLALVVAGVGFKLALVPFHLWTPDVYQGAPAPVTAFVATASKGAVFAVLLRFFIQVHAQVVLSLALAISLIAVVSMFVGNLLALKQTNIKRILAYSSIAHLGYLLIALRARGPLAVEAIGYYLAAYVLTMLAAFGVVTVLSSGEREAEDLDDYRGLFWRRPWLAATLSTALLSLAAIPLTGGFVGKFYIVAAGASSSLWPLLIVLALNSGIGLYYYLRILVAMYSTGGEAARFSEPKVSAASGLALAALVAGVLWLGIYPAPLVRLLRSASPAVITAVR